MVLEKGSLGRHERGAEADVVVGKWKKFRFAIIK